MLILAVVSLLGIKRQKEEDRAKKEIENESNEALDLGIVNLNIYSSDSGEVKYYTTGVVNKSLIEEQVFSVVKLEREGREESLFTLSEEAGAQSATCDASETDVEENSEHENFAAAVKQQEGIEKVMVNGMESEEKQCLTEESVPHSSSIHERAEDLKTSIVNPSYQDNEERNESGPHVTNYHDEVPKDPESD